MKVTELTGRCGALSAGRARLAQRAGGRGVAATTNRAHPIETTIRTSLRDRPLQNILLQ